MLSRLSRRFPAKDVKTRKQAGMTLHYIDIPETIKRFNEACGRGYDFTVDEVRVEPTGDETRSGKPTFRAVVRGHVTVPDLGTRGGVGSHESHDVDMAVKSAQAEAMKKCGHQFGVGLHLWDERERKLVDLVNAGEMAKAAKLLMKIEGLTAGEVKERFDSAEHFLGEFGLL